MKKRGSPVELYRIETPFDVIGAVAVAKSRPPESRKILLISPQKSGAPKPIEAAIRALASAYPWAGVVDLSSLPLNDPPGGGAWNRIARLRESHRWLDTKLREVLQEDSYEVDAVGISCIAHPDHQVVLAHFPDAWRMLLIHNSCNFSEHEHTYYSRFLAPGAQAKMRSRAANWGKRLILGERSALPLKYQMDEAFFLRRPFRWAPRNTQLEDLLRPETMSEFLAFLPPSSKALVDELARDAGSEAGLLLLPPDDPALSEEAEIQACVDLVPHISDELRRSVFLKPHPMSSEARNRRTIATLQLAYPTCRLIHLAQLDYVPVEIIARGLGIARCGTVNSSAIWFLKTALGIDCYYPAAAVLRMSAAALDRGLASSLRQQTLQDWVTEFGSVYTSI